MNLNSAEPEIIRLREGKGYDGVLNNIEPGEEGYILAGIEGFIVELPAECEDKLRPLMGQPTRVAFLLGWYHAAKYTRRQDEPPVSPLDGGTGRW
jgi:hypothetical protein